MQVAIVKYSFNVTSQDSSSYRNWSQRSIIYGTACAFVIRCCRLFWSTVMIFHRDMPYSRQLCHNSCMKTLERIWQAPNLIFLDKNKEKKNTRLKHIDLILVAYGSYSTFIRNHWSSIARIQWQNCAIKHFPFIHYK